MADNKFSEEYEKSIKKYEAQLRAQEQAGKDFLGTMADIRKLEKEIELVEKSISKQREYQDKLERRKVKETDPAKIRLMEEALRLAKEHTDQLEAQNEEYKENVKLLNKSALSIRNVAKSTLNWGKETLKVNLSTRNLWKYLMDVDSTIKTTSLSMGIAGKFADGFRTNMLHAARYSESMGLAADELAKSYGEYSELVGKNVAMSKENLEQIADIAKGTALGASGAVKFLSAMEQFNKSVKSSHGYVTGIVNEASRMGLNATKMLKDVESALERGRAFYIRDGVKGLKDMAFYSGNIRQDMNDVFGFSEKVRNFEGAIESAANLQVLGGNIAGQLGDPLKLLYQSRNDLKEFSKSIGEATKGMAYFDKESGSFQILPQEFDRLNEMAKATGMSFDKLSDMAKEFNKKNMLKNMVSPEIKFAGKKEDRDLMNLLMNSAQYDDGKKKWTVDIDGRQVEISKVMLEQARQLKGDQRSLEEMGRQAQTFDDAFRNTFNMLKSVMLPALRGINGMLNGFMKLRDGFFNLFDKGGEKMPEKFKTASIAGTAVMVTALGTIFNRVVMRGLGFQLGLGFKEAAGLGGGKVGAGEGFAGSSAWSRKWSKVGSSPGMGRKIGRGVGIAGGLLGTGIELTEAMTGKSSAWADTLAGVGNGAAIGSAAGPWGAGIGALLGGLAGYFMHEDTPKMAEGGIVSRPTMAMIGEGRGPEAVIPLDKLPDMMKQTGSLNMDKFMAPLQQLISSLQQVVSQMGNAFKPGGEGTGKFKMEFEPIKVQFDSGNISQQLLEDPVFMQHLTKQIMGQLGKDKNGGKN